MIFGERKDIYIYIYFCQYWTIIGQSINLIPNIRRKWNSISGVMVCALDEGHFTKDKYIYVNQVVFKVRN